MTPTAARAPLADADEGSTVLHVWLPAGHTLCELEAGDYARERLAELEASHSAVCGPCLLIVSRVRREASALLEMADERVAPDLPSEAWRLLDKSNWGSKVDIKRFLRTTPDIDARTRLDAIRYEVDPESVASLVDEMSRARAGARRGR
jgi:hypothetical protein